MEEDSREASASGMKVEGLSRRVATTESVPPRLGFTAGRQSGVADATRGAFRHLSPRAKAARLPSAHRYAMAPTREA
jgi:hypothetical protein